MRLLFLACLSPKTGNCTTAERIRDHVESAGHVCVLRDVVDFSSPADVASLVMGEPSFEGALAIHLYKGGRLLLGSKAPFGIIFGGTDLNEDVKDEKKRAVMEQVLKKARFAVAFSCKMKKEAEVFWLSQSSKIYIQPQGIETKAAASFSWRAFLKSSGVNGAGVENLHVFLLVCGLRRVKDPLYLIEAFSEWHAENPSVIMIIIGPKDFFTITATQYGEKYLATLLNHCIQIDPVLTREVEVNVERSRGVYLASERSQEELHAALKMCFALVNSSISEGMSGAILEAMYLGVPVVARDIPGNAAIIQHEDTGLLFTTPQEFVTTSKRLLEDGPLLERIVRNGKRYVKEFHSLAEERTVYQKLVELLQ